LIERFERAHARLRGTVSGNVPPENGSALALDGDPAWADACQLLHDAALEGLRHYLRRYAHTALGPIRLQVPDPATGAMTTLRARGLSALDDEALSSVILQLFRPGSIDVRKFQADEDRSPYWASDLHPNPALDSGESLHRVLLWTIFLNDDYEAGETEFLYQGRKIAPRAGSLLIAPTAFTHTHRGNRPRGGDKYIATSWILFQRAEALYAR